MGVELTSRHALNYPPFTISVHPKLEDIHSAFKDFVLFANWTRVAIVFERDDKAQESLLLQDTLLGESVDTLVRKMVYKQGSCWLPPLRVLEYMGV